MYLGIDIGGTNIKLGLVDLNGSDPVIVQRSSFPFAGMSYKDLCRAITDNTEKMLESSGLKLRDITGAGLSVPGLIDPENGIILHAYNLGYHDVPIRSELLKDLPGIKIAMTNDANAAALAELHAGALKGCRNAMLLTIGTGLGAGLILDGKVFNGGQGHGCEIGHMPFKDGGKLCSCGRRGCMEAYASASSIAERGRELLGEEYADAKAVLDLYAAGNKTAGRIIDSYLDDLSSVIAGLCNAFDPEKIAVGGGFSAAGDILYGPLNSLVAKKNFFGVPYKIVPARFLNDSGILGAAYHVHLT